MRKSKRKYEPITIPYKLDEYSFGSWLKNNASWLAPVGAIGATILTGGLAAPTLAPALGVGAAGAGAAAAGAIGGVGAIAGTTAATAGLAGAATGGLGLSAIGSGLGAASKIGGAIANKASQEDAIQEKQQMMLNQANMQNNAELTSRLQKKQIQNIPTFPNGGTLSAPTTKSKVKETRSLQGYKDPTTGQTFYPVQGSTANINREGVFPFDTDDSGNVLYGTYMAPHTAKGIAEQDYLPTIYSTDTDTNITKSAYPSTNLMRLAAGADPYKGRTQLADYSLMDKYITNPMTNPPQEMATRANGGIINYSGQDHSGMDGGIPVDAQGNPSVVSKNKPIALTENKEVTWLTPEGDSYVFSDRLGYSEKANKLIGKYKKRLGGKLDGIDELAWKGLHGDLARLSGEQETERNTRVSKITGKIDKYKKELGGYIDLTKKEHGGALMEYANGGPFDPYGAATGAQYAAEAAPYSYRPQALSGVIPTNQPTIDPSMMNQQYAAASGQPTQFTGNVSPLGAIGSMVGNAIMMGNNKAQNVNLPRVQAEQVDLSQQRASARENYLNSRANMMQRLKSAGLSPAQYTQAVMSGNADLNTIANQTIGQSLESQANTNAGLRGQANSQNAQMASQEAMINSQAQQEADYMNQQYTSNILQAPLNYLGEKQRASQIYDMANAEGKAVMYNDPKNTLAQKLLGLKKYQIKARQ